MNHKKFKSSCNCKPQKYESNLIHTHRNSQKPLLTVIKVILNIISMILFFGGVAGMCWLDVTQEEAIFGFTPYQLFWIIVIGILIFILVARLSSAYFD